MCPAFTITRQGIATPEEVLNYLVERTGLLREPAGDLIDFPHRSLQEYLAAVRRAPRARRIFWPNRRMMISGTETIMLAAGIHTGGVHFWQAPWLRRCLGAESVIRAGDRRSLSGGERLAFGA